MPETVPVTAVIAVKDPNMDHLQWTLDSLADQNKVPEEVIIIDSSMDPLRSATAERLDIRLVHAQGDGISTARRRGVELAQSRYIIHLDEDAVLLNENHMTRAIEVLQTEGVAGVGGVTRPIRGNKLGEGIALLSRFNPSSLSTHYIMHRRKICVEGDRCHFVGHRGEDITLRDEIKEAGDIVRDSTLVILKDLPTQRQETFLDSIKGTAAGALVGSVTSLAVKAGIDALETEI